MTLGRVTGVFGVKGWVKIESYASPREGILDYEAWQVGDVHREVQDGRPHGNGLVAKLAGIDDRDAAVATVGAPISVARSELPELPPGEHYWTDLFGMRVETESGELLGTLADVMSNGAQDVMVVRGARELLIPFVMGPLVKRIDRAAGCIVVDWSAEY